MKMKGRHVERGSGGAGEMIERQELSVRLF